MMLRTTPVAFAAAAALTTMPVTALARVQEPTAAASATESPVGASSSETPGSSARAEDLARRREGARKLRLGGLVTMGIGGGLVVIGGGIAGGYSTGAIGAKGLWSGVAMAGVGLPIFIAGIIAYSVGNKRMRTLASSGTARLRVGPLLGRGQGGLALMGRF